MAGIVKFPFGKADVRSVGYTASISVDVLNMETIVNVGTLTGALTIDLSISHQVDAGANLSIKVTVDDTNRVVTFGTGFTAVAHTATADKIFLYSFKYDGKTFVQTSVMQLN